MIDLHSHILPGIDDGAADLDESLAIARMAVADGIHQMIATPHNTDWERIGSRGDLNGRLSTLQAALDDAGIPLRMYPGSEVHITPDLVERVRADQVISLNNSRYVLIELPFFTYPHYVEQIFFEIAVEGITPVVAHAERYAAVQEKPELLAPLVERGVLVQITSLSLVGDFGKQARRAAVSLLTRGLAHVIASDGHNTHSRPPLLSEAVSVAAAHVGESRARKMVTEIPQAILDNTPLVVDPPQPVSPRKKWFGLW